MTTKQKYVILGLVVLFVISYFFAFRKTVALNKQYKSLAVKEQLYTSAPKRMSALRGKDKAYNQFLKEQNLSENSLNNDLLQALHVLAVTHKLLIQEFNDPHIFVDENTKSKTTTYIFSLKGSYAGILKLIYELEQKYAFGNITYLNFEKKKNYRSGKNYLICAMHLQRLEAVD